MQIYALAVGDLNLWWYCGLTVLIKKVNCKRKKYAFCAFKHNFNLFVWIFRLIEAMKKGNHTEIKRLLDKGIDVNYSEVFVQLFSLPRQFIKQDHKHLLSRNSFTFYMVESYSCGKSIFY